MSETIFFSYEVDISTFSNLIPNLINISNVVRKWFRGLRCWTANQEVPGLSPDATRLSLLDH